MSNSKSKFFYELCRLCLENTGVCNTLESNDLLQDIYECTGVIISQSDNLPHKICNKCSSIVQDAKALKTLATKNDSHLRCLFDINCCDEICKNDDSNLNTILNPENQNLHSNGLHSESITDNNETHNDIKSKVDSCQEEMVTPIINQTISLRKDLFYKSSPCTSPIKISKSEDSDYYEKLLKAKVKQENRGTKRKSDGDDEITVEYVCGICSKEFETQKKFYLHQRLHNKKLCCPFDICAKKFATKGDLEKHTRTHTGEKPFECPECGKGFTQKVSLRAHMTSVHTKHKEETEGD